MAQKVIIQLVDDMDGTSEAAATVEFGLDGTAYEIDLNGQHCAELRSGLARYVEHARKVSVRSRGGAGKVKQDSAHRSDTTEVRTWLVAHGYGGQLKDRGRIPDALREKYDRQIPAPVATVPTVAAKEAAPVEDTPPPPEGGRTITAEYLAANPEKPEARTAVAPTAAKRPRQVSAKATVTGQKGVPKPRKQVSAKATTVKAETGEMG
jgi:nucleoid-associated protein Lsr2